ncbi:MAG TPA: 2-dehydropantoate 2-reductase [Candidatus Acidoferrales bacterium]|nr:2-dehydropantoate 2-reductase [Candidatus Acidoferrales bacterium]
MNHAILGAGGVGGLLGAALARGEDRVLLLLRPETLDKHPDHLWLESPFGDIKVPVRRTTVLEEPVDVLWIAVKAPQLDAALHAVPAGASRIGTIVPLLNGIDHVALLRSRYGQQGVLPATIAVEAERVGLGHIIQRSPFVRLALSARGERQLAGVTERLRQFGFTCDFQADEQTMLWSKLAFLAPFALVSTATDKTKGEIFVDPTWRERLRSAVREACAVAVREGAAVDGEKILTTLESLPATMRSSMQKDVAAGRIPELDAIGGPIVRGGLKYGVDVAVTQDLVARIGERLKKQA